MRNFTRLYRAARSAPAVGRRRDILNGALLGDFAPRLGLPGALTQIVLSLIPGVGDVAAVRDMLAARRRRDSLDLLLNLLVMLPVLGAAARAAEVARNMRRVGRALYVVRRPVGSLAGGWPDRRAA